MSIETTNVGDTCSASVDRGASYDEGIKMHGFYHVECYGSDGELKWEDDIHNLVTTVGKNLTITGALTNAAQGVSYMGLKGTGTAVVGDTQASHTWLEVGATNAPTYTAPRKTPTWGTASAGAISPTVAQIFAMTSSGTVAGCFINVGGTSAIDNTTGTLFSAGDFSGGSKTVSNGDSLSVTYTATAA
jgi:hypothetical protein